MLRRPAVLAVVLGIVVAREARAQLPLTPEFQVNTYTTNAQLQPAIATDSAGNFIVVWRGDIQPGVDSDIFARAYQADGTPLGPSEFRVNAYTIGAQFEPAVAVDPTGGFVVAWTSASQDGQGLGIFARRYDASGTPGPEFRVNTYTTSDQSFPSVAVDGGGNFVVAWESYGQDGSDGGVFARRYDASGAPQGSEFQVNVHTMNEQGEPSVAMDAAGDFVVAWSGVGAAGVDGIFARRYDASGVAQGGGFRVTTYTTTRGQTGASVALAPDGRFVVAWSSDGQDGSDYGIFARRYNASGDAQSPAFQVNEHTTDAQQWGRVSMMAPDGSFVVAWQSYGQEGHSLGTFARFFAAEGTAQSGEFQLNSYTTGDQSFPVVAAQPGGRFVAAWNSLGQDGSSTGVIGRRFARDVIFADGFESGDLSKWSAVSTDGGDLSLSALAAMKLTGVGLRGVVNDTTALYVEDDSPDNEDRYRARFYLDTNGFDPGETGGARRTRMLIVFEEAPTRRLATIVLKRLNGAYSLEGRCRQDDDSQADTGFFPITDGVHAVELDWKRSGSAVANDGSFELWIDGVSQKQLTGLANSVSSVDFVRMGALTVKATAAGTLFWDEFESRRASYIGP